MAGTTRWHAHRVLGLVMVLVSLLAASSAKPHDTRATEIDGWNMRLHMATQTPYHPIGLLNDTTPLPDGCTTIFTYYLGRNGVRYPSEHEVQEFDRVIAKVQEGESVPYYVRQADNPFRHPAPGDLHPIGEAQLYDIAQRLKLHHEFHHIWRKYSPERHVLRAASNSFTSRSASALTFGLFENDGLLGDASFQPVYIHTQPNDCSPEIRFDHILLATCKTVEQQFSANASNIVKQAREVYMEPVASRLNSFWGLSGTTALSAADVEVFALYCSYLLAFEDAGAAQFCSIFEDEELVRWDYIQDLKLYYQYGYGFAPMVDAAFTILRDVYLTMENVIQRKSLERAKLYVGQHQTLLPLLALLELFQDSEPLYWNATISEIQTRRWKSSRLAPYGANVMFNLYHCGTQDYRVKALVNEAEVMLPACASVYCPFRDLWQTLWPKLSIDFRTLCRRYGGTFDLTRVCTTTIGDEYLHVQSPETGSVHGGYSLTLTVGIALVCVASAAPFFALLGALLACWYTARVNRRLRPHRSTSLQDDDDDDEEDDGL